AIDGVEKTPATVLADLNRIGGANGIGRLDIVENRYGGMKAKLEQIGADTITDEDKKTTYYLIKLRTDKSHLGTDEKPLLIIPGMVATVDIMTGKKTIMSYLLKPIIKARSEALRER
ncbi:MAG: argininosuccinate synthase, partial [Pseudomonas sp.]|nr:argininosuccinate synthase [Pseudomonas sp.]